jgi:hypothetical protein
VIGDATKSNQLLVVRSSNSYLTYMNSSFKGKF